VAWEQFGIPLAGKRPAGGSKPVNGELELQEDARAVTLSAGDFAVSFGRRSGTMESLRYGGREMLATGPELAVWRAATDNDGFRHNPTLKTRPLARWLEAGLNELKRTTVECRVSRGRDGSVSFHAHHRIGRKRTAPGFEHQQTFRVFADGSIAVSNVIECDEGLPELPRLGVRMALVPAMENVTWFGRGPHENYWDRKAGAAVGVYHATVDEMYTPYILPQENGNRTDVRWVTLSDRRGRGICVTAEPLFEFTASHFTANDLFAARHTNDLIRREEVLLNLDYHQRGLGTASCGPDTREEYRLLPGKYRLTYHLSAVGV